MDKNHKIPLTKKKGANSGCWSYVGMQGGRQQLNLQPSQIEVGCFRLGTVIHEYLHAVGFFHMQSATERDDYVRIVWENIQAGTERNFDKYNASYITNFGVGEWGDEFMMRTFLFSTFSLKIMTMGV